MSPSYRKVLIPNFIDGVLVHREVLYEPEVRFECHVRFKYHRYTFPSCALSWPGAYSDCIPMLRQLLGIRIFHTSAPDDIPWPANLSYSPYFFGYWPSADRWQSKYSRALSARSMVFFRDDLKPLHPKQLEALWCFCDRLYLVVTPPLLLEYTLPDRLASLRWELKTKYPFVGQSPEHKFEKLVGLIQAIWEDHCTVDNYSAFFEVHRRIKLLRGDESWREVGSFYAT